MDTDRDIKVNPYEYEKKIFNNTCHTFIKPGASREDLEQVDSDMDEKEDPYKFKDNLFKYIYRTFIKSGASREEEYIIGRTLSRWTVTWTRMRTPTSSRRTSSNIYVAPLSKQEHPDKINMSLGGP